MKNRTKKRIRFPKRPGVTEEPVTRRSELRPGDGRQTREPLSQALLPATPAAAEQVSEQIRHACSCNRHCTGPLRSSIVLWEKGGGENSVSRKQEDIKNDRREKEKQLVPRPILTSVNCFSRRKAQIRSGPSDTLIPQWYQQAANGPSLVLAVLGAPRTPCALGGSGHWKGASAWYLNKRMGKRKMHCLDLSVCTWNTGGEGTWKETGAGSSSGSVLKYDKRLESTSWLASLSFKWHSYFSDN